MDGRAVFFVFFPDLDLSLSPTGKVVKKAGDSLPVTVEKKASGDISVSWTKVGMENLEDMT